MGGSMILARTAAGQPFSSSGTSGSGSLMFSGGNYGGAARLRARLGSVARRLPRPDPRAATRAASRAALREMSDEELYWLEAAIIAEEHDLPFTKEQHTALDKYERLLQARSGSSQ